MIAIVLIIALAVCYIVTAICYTINNQYIDDYAEIMTNPSYIDLEQRLDASEDKLDQIRTICIVTREAVKKTDDDENKQALYDLALTRIINI